MYAILLNCFPETRITQPFRRNKERLELTMCQPFNDIGILRIAAVQTARSDFVVLAALHQIAHECNGRENTNQQTIRVQGNHREKADRLALGGSC